MQRRMVDLTAGMHRFGGVGVVGACGDAGADVEFVAGEGVARCGARASENLSVYPSLSRAGKSRPPSAKMVTPEAPVKAVNTAHSASEMTARPPGSQPRLKVNNRTSNGAMTKFGKTCAPIDTPTAR